MVAWIGCFFDFGFDNLEQIIRHKSKIHLQITFLIDILNLRFWKFFRFHFCLAWKLFLTWFLPFYVKWPWGSSLCDQLKLPVLKIWFHFILLFCVFDIFVKRSWIFIKFFSAQMSLMGMYFAYWLRYYFFFVIIFFFCYFPCSFSCVPNYRRTIMHLKSVLFSLKANFSSELKLNFALSFCLVVFNFNCLHGLSGRVWI